MMPQSKPTSKDVAAWMFSELKRDIEIYQESIVADIVDKFGESFAYENAAGNLGIDKDVLAAFKEIAGNEVVWERSRRVWRFREKGDNPGRAQP